MAVAVSLCWHDRSTNGRSLGGGLPSTPARAGAGLNAATRPDRVRSRQGPGVLMHHDPLTERPKSSVAPANVGSRQAATDPRSAIAERESLSHTLNRKAGSTGCCPRVRAAVSVVIRGRNGSLCYDRHNPRLRKCDASQKRIKGWGGSDVLPAFDRAAGLARGGQRTPSCVGKHLRCALDDACFAPGLLCSVSWRKRHGGIQFSSSSVRILR